MEPSVRPVIDGRNLVAVPGVAVALVANGRSEIWCDGVTSVANPLPIHGRTLFQLGSVSKLFTATAAVALIDGGAVGLNDRVADLLEDVDFGDAGASLTVEHLLTHRGGWQGDWSLFNAPPGRDSAGLREMTGRAAHVPRYSEPGGPFSYDNFGTCVLGALIEEITGVPFDVAVRDLVLNPLDLRDSVYWADDAIWRRVAVGHTAAGELAEGTEPWADVWPARRAIWPQGGVVASAADSLAFATFHATGTSTVAGRGPLGPAARADMQVARAPSGGQGSAVALGWHIRYAAGEAVLTHTGAAQGSFARMALVPTRSSALVVLTNGASGPTVANSIFEWYLNRVLNLTIDRPAPAPPPDNPASLIGEYRAITRSISVELVRDSTVVARVVDTGPTWAGTEAFELSFCEGQRLLAGDGTSMEYGSLDDGRAWIRFRGRVHVRI